MLSVELNWDELYVAMTIRLCRRRSFLLKIKKLGKLSGIQEAIVVNEFSQPNFSIAKAQNIESGLYFLVLPLCKMNVTGL